MIHRKVENVKWLEFEQLQDFPELVHGVFLRHGGVSKRPFSSLNIGGGTGDSEDAIDENKRRLCACLGIDPPVSATQVHGNCVELVESNSFEKECDGLLTKKNFPLLITHADCQAAIFFDPIKRCVGLVHAGWRGHVLNIYQKTVKGFNTHFGSHPENLLVCISPSLGPTHAEFIHYKKELPRSFEAFKVGECHFDFWALSKWQLEKAGVLPQHIEIAKMCTFSEQSDFFSFRRDKKTGRHGTVVALKESPRYC